MILTFKVKHGKDFSQELILAKKIAQYAIENRTISTADVKHFGLKSVISNQIIRKYSRNKNIKAIHNIKLTISGHFVRIIDGRVYIPCLLFSVPIFFNKNFTKINQVEIGQEYIYISVSYPDAPKIPEKNTIGVDRNSTHHGIVASCLETGKVLKLGKSCSHIHQKYNSMKKCLQKMGKLKKVKAITSRESRIVKDINHKITKALVLFARGNDACLVLEDLKEIRKTAKTRKKQRYSFHSWSFYQQKAMIEYKAKKYGVSVHYVEPQYTSQRCSHCGHIEQANRKGNLFCCKECGIVEDSGVNAGFNIAYMHKNGIPRFVIESDMAKGSTDTPREATV